MSNPDYHPIESGPGVWRHRLPGGSMAYGSELGAWKGMVDVLSIELGEARALVETMTAERAEWCVELAEALELPPGVEQGVPLLEQVRNLRKAFVEKTNRIDGLLERVNTCREDNGKLAAAFDRAVESVARERRNWMLQ